MASLKKYEERLAALMNTTHAALYERQRRLVRLGLLKAPDKTGPGGGIRATPETVAMLILSCLVTDSWSEVGEEVGRFGRIKPNEGRCPLTKATSFGAALTRILADPDIAGEVMGVIVQRTRGMADIGFEFPGLQQSIFGRHPKRPGWGPIEVSVHLSGRLLKTVADDLTKESASMSSTPLPPIHLPPITVGYGSPHTKLSKKES
jgi:hypothetical protein